MKRNLILILLTVLMSCSKSKKPDIKEYQVPKKIIIAGKIDSIDTKKLDVKLIIRDLYINKELNVKADSLGNFYASFEDYYPTSIVIGYNTYNTILARPGDSIYLKFNGKHKKRIDLLKSIEFSGDAIKENQDATKFQIMCFSDSLYNDWTSHNRAVKEYNVDKYVMYLDTLKEKINNFHATFVNEVKPTKEVENWAKMSLDSDIYYNRLIWYPNDHLRANKLTKKEWDVPNTYYDLLLSALPVKKEKLIYGGRFLYYFSMSFHRRYIMKEFFNDEQNKKYKTIEEYSTAPAHVRDSIEVYSTIKYTPDTLFRQIVLTQYFNIKLEQSNIDPIEKHRDIVDKYIKEPFLIKPLIKKYNKLENHIKNPKIAKNAHLEKLENYSANQIFNFILEKNKGKNIYLECWATWCAPCKEEMPKTKKLMEEIEGKNIVFAFLNVDSKEEAWKANLSEFQIGGQHYYLDKEQSSEIRKFLKVEGIPYYFLINEEGKIVEQGLPPREGISAVVRKKIKKLLQDNIRFQ